MEPFWQKFGTKISHFFHPITSMPNPIINNIFSGYMVSKGTDTLLKFNRSGELDRFISYQPMGVPR